MAEQDRQLALEISFSIPPWSICPDEGDTWNSWSIDLNKYIGPFYSYSQALSFYRSVNR